MSNQTKGFTVTQNETVVYVETTSIHINKEKEQLYLVDKAYKSLRLSIEHFGIKEPLIVEKESNVVIAGNRRLKVAIELGLQNVPVIFRELGDNDRKIVYITHENQREKTYSQYLAEYRILQQRYPLSQGARTDLKQVAALNSEALRVLTGISRTTLFYLLEIDRLAIAKYKNGKESKTYKHIWNDLDEGYKTPKYWYDKLKPREKDTSGNSSLATYSLLFSECKVINSSCEDVSGIEDESISCFVSSPPYWGYKRTYGKAKGEIIGNEKDANDYLKKLVSIYKNALPKLKKDGSIWVNIADVCKNGEYHVIPHRFVLMMQKIGLVLNDEIVWVKKNPTPTSGQRMTKSFENLFQFIRKEDKKSFYYDVKWAENGNALKSVVATAGGEFEKNNIESSLNFRDGILITTSPNIQKLRKVCKKRGINGNHDATFPIDLAMVPILLTTKEKDTVLDLFGGTGTVALVAGALGRKSISYEQNPEYCKMTEVRLTDLISQWESVDFDEDNTETILEQVEKVAA